MSSETEARQLWQLLDYVAVDYPGAVQHVSVVSAVEYGEMQEFTARAESQVLALPKHPLQAELSTAAVRL